MKDVFHGLGTGQFNAPVVLPTVVAFYRRTRLFAVIALPIVLTAACGKPMPSSPTPDATDFRSTSDLRPGGEQSFDMTRLGTTRIHCANHPNMTDTLIVREH